MPAPKTYTRAQWDEFARLLDALPEKPSSEQRLTVRDAMRDVRAHINAARVKGIHSSSSSNRHGRLASM